MHTGSTALPTKSGHARGFRIFQLVHVHKKRDNYPWQPGKSKILLVTLVQAMYFNWETQLSDTCTSSYMPSSCYMYVSVVVEFSTDARGSGNDFENQGLGTNHGVKF